MAVVNELVNRIRYEVDNSGLAGMRAGLNRARAYVGSIGTSIREGWVLGVRDAISEQKKLAAGSANVAKGVNKAADATMRVEDGFRNIAGYVKGILLGIGVMGSAKIADEWAGTNARIELAVDPTEVKRALSEIYDIANRAGQEYNATGDLFSKIARNQKELGLFTEQSLQLTEIISKAMTIGGGSAASQSAALVQLGQALGSGTLRGDELNSIIEQSPRLAQSIAEAFGVTVGKLKDLGSQGKLTAKELANGLLKQAEKIDAEFEKMPKTFARGMLLIKNAYGRFINDLNRASRASEIFYSITKLVADNMRTIVKLAAFAALTYGLTKAGGLATAILSKIRGAGMASLWPFLRMAALLTGIYLIGEDILVWARGGESVFGQIVGRVGEWKTEIEAVRGILEWIKNILGDTSKTVGQFLIKWGAIAASGYALLRIVGLMLRGFFAVIGPVGTLLRILGTIGTILAAIIGWPATIAIAVAAVGVAIYKEFDSIKKFVDDTIDSITGYFSKKWEAAIKGISDLAKKILPDSWFDTSGLSLEQRQANDLAARATSGTDSATAAQLETAGGAYLGAGRRGRNQVNNINNQVVVNAQTNSPAAVGNAAAGAVSRATTDAVTSVNSMPTVEAAP
jgi:tape measure domain-containing protein